MEGLWVSNGYVITCDKYNFSCICLLDFMLRLDQTDSTLLNTTGCQANSPSHHSMLRLVIKNDYYTRLNDHNWRAQSITVLCQILAATTTTKLVACAGNMNGKVS